MVEHVVVETVKYKSLNGLLYDNEKTAEFWDAQWREQNEFTEADYRAYAKIGRNKIKFLENRLSETITGGVIVWENRYDKDYYVFEGINGFIDALKSLFNSLKIWGYLDSSADQIMLEMIANDPDQYNISMVIIGFINRSPKNLSIDYVYSEIYK